jgi:thiol-disulfide isomerase/thioredoxin
LKIIVTAYFVFFYVFSSFAQEKLVEVYHFDKFQTFLKKNNDTLYIFNFWATWCKPCVEELPFFDKINQYYKDQKVKVILVSLDFSDEIETRLIPFLQKKDIKSKVIVLDESNPNTFIDKICPEWSGAIPATLIFKEMEFSFYEQSFTYDELNSIVKQKLSK